MPDASKTSSPNWRSHQCTPSNRPRKHTRAAIPQAQHLPASTRPKPTSTAPGGFGGLTSLQKSRTRIIWGLWHLPLLNVPGEHDNGLPLPGCLLLVLATSVLINGLVNAAGGSVLIAAIFQAAFDASYSYTGVVGGDHALLWRAAVVTSVVAIVAVIGTRGRLF